MRVEIDSCARNTTRGSCFAWCAAADWHRGGLHPLEHLQTNKRGNKTTKQQLLWVVRLNLGDKVLKYIFYFPIFKKKQNAIPQDTKANFIFNKINSWSGTIQRFYCFKHVQFTEVKKTQNNWSIRDQTVEAHSSSYYYYDYLMVRHLGDLIWKTSALAAHFGSKFYLDPLVIGSITKTKKKKSHISPSTTRPPLSSARTRLLRYIRHTN